MLQALWSASSGMLAQQMAMDTVGNNLANINTYGYKKSRVDFEDLLYNQIRQPETVTRTGQVIPNALQVGVGVRPAATKMLFDQGNLEQTGNNTDLALSGNGFFEIILPDGQRAYTRDGSFNIDADGYLVAANGYLSNMQAVDGGLLKFSGVEASELMIDDKGVIYQQTPLLTLEAYTFTSPKDLEKTAEGLYIPTEDSGEPLTLEEARELAAEEETDDEGNPIPGAEEPKYQAYYQVVTLDGEVGYTPANQFKVNDEGMLVTLDKEYPLDPEVTLELQEGDPNLKPGSVLTANEEGIISHSTEMGRINLVRFTNPAGLERSGSNMYLATENSGQPQTASDVRVVQGYIETSNVQMAEEMVNMMMAQRAYELNSRSIKTSDEMLGMANSILRR